MKQRARDPEHRTATRQADLEHRRARGDITRRLDIQRARGTKQSCVGWMVLLSTAMALLLLLLLEAGPVPQVIISFFLASSLDVH